MKIYFAAAAAAVFVVPAAANAQAYVQAQGGFDSVSVLGASDEGVAFGVAAGYDFALSETVFAGIEASVDDSTTKECARDIDVVGDELCIKTGRDLSAVVRLGTKLSAADQLYVLGGYTNARLKVTYDDGVDSFGEGANGDGVRLGAGYRRTFSNNVFAKLEYRYSNYEADFSRHNVLAAVGVTF